MAQFTHRINLKKTASPLLSSELGRSVLVPNSKEAGTGEDANEPEILYMHNVMPTSRGLQSVGFKDIIEAPTGGDATTKLIKAIPLLNEATNAAGTTFKPDSPHLVAYLAPPFASIYLLEETDTTWTKVVTPLNAVTEFHVTVANTAGESYMLLGLSSPYCYSQTHGLIAKAFTGSPIHFILGITGAFGYLIAWGAELNNKTSAIAWSSLLDPLDLTPSAITGAGTATVEGAKGHVLACVPNSTGFLVYCLHNVVAAIYTGNKAFPFKFVPVEGSKGLGTSNTNNIASVVNPYVPGLIASEPDSYGHFMFGGTSGLQLVNSKKATVIYPEVTDFITGKLLEDFNETTKTFSLQEVGANEEMMKKIAYIASRYLVISYGLVEFTHALVYDIQLNKVGKIRFTHVDAFESNFRVVAGTDQRELAKESIAFMDKTGKVSVVSFNPIDTTRTGVLILGKYQYVRDRLITLQKVTCENVVVADDFEFIDMPSLDGRNISSNVSATETSGVGYREFALRSSGKNHSLAFIGKFILNSLELLFTINGRR